MLVLAGLLIAFQPVAASDPFLTVYLGIDPVAASGRRFGLYPAAVGDTWTYRRVEKRAIDGTDAVAIITCCEDVCIDSVVTIPEGKVLCRSRKIHDLKCECPDSVSKKVKPVIEYDTFLPHILVLKSGYMIELPAEWWDGTKKQLTPLCRDRLEHPDNPAVEPSLAQLLAGSLPDRDQRMFVGIVSKGEDIGTPYGAIKEAIPIQTLYNNGRETRWFKEKLGYVQETFHHGGTSYEEELSLVQFMRGKR